MSTLKYVLPFLVLVLTGWSNRTNAQTTPLSVSVNSINAVSCYGVSNGGATAIATGGNPPYSYSWNTVPVQTTATVSNVPAGYYIVTVTDNSSATVSVTTQINAALPPDSWSIQADFGGGNRSSGIAFAIGTKGYVGLGTSNGTDYLSDIWEYNQTTGAWTQMANYAGGGMVGASCFVVGTKGYVGNGTNAPSTWSNALYEYDPSTNVWAAKASFPASARNNGTGFAIGNKGYFVCGTSSSNDFNDLWEYTPSTNAWAGKASFPGAVRHGASAFSIGTKAYIGCGFVPSLNAADDDFYEYNQTSNTWTQKATYPGGAGEGISSFAIAGKGYFCGGNYSIYHDSLWEYESLGDSWTVRSQLPGSKRSYGGGFSIGNKGYITLGYSPTIAANLDDLWQYTPEGLNPSPIIFGPNAVCGLTSAVYSVSAMVGATYTWTVPSGITILSGQGTASISVSLNGTVNGTITCVVNDACGSSPAGTLLVTKKPQPPAAIFGPASACGLTTATYYITPVSGATSYAWTVPTGVTVVSGAGTTSLTVNIASTFKSGNIGVTAINVCGNNSATTLTITAHVQVAPASMTGVTNVCGFTSGTYSVPAVAFAQGYYWIVPDWMTINSGQGTTSINVTANATPWGGAISAAVTNACGSGAPRVLNLTVASLQPGVISGPTALCGLGTATWSVPSLGTGYTYNWALTMAGWSIVSGIGTNSITATGPVSSNNSASGTVKVTSTNTCGNLSPVRSLAVTYCHYGVEMNEEAELSPDVYSDIYPNPATTEFIIDVTSDTDKDATMEVFDISGKRIIYEMHRLITGITSLKTNMEMYAKGMYFVRLLDVDSNVIHSQTVIKQ